MTVKMVTDSTSYIPKKWINEYDIQIASLNIIFDDEIVKEVEITNEEFYLKLKNYGKIPKSSQPTVQEMYRIFEDIVKNGDEVVGIFISSDMSGTFSTANLVKNMILEKYENASIEIVDSRSNSMQLGYAVVVGGRAAKEGKTKEEVLEIVNNNIKCSKFIFVPDNFEYLEKGGRIGKAQSVIGTALKVKLVLSVIDGKTDVLYKIRTKKKAVNKMVEEFLFDIDKFGFGEALIHHINCEEDALSLAKLIEEKTGRTIGICPIGPVIGTHVGPGTIAMVYYTKNEMINLNNSKK
jgi:DegV family protein with EDD domain